MESCQRQTTSPSATDTISFIGSAGSYGPSGRAACIPAWTCWRAFLSSGSATPQKLAAFWVNLYVGQSYIPKWGMCYLKNPKRPTKHCASYLVAKEARCNWKGWISLCVPHHWSLSSFPKGEYPWILIGLIFHHLMHICFTNNSSLGSISIVSSIKWTSVDTLWKRHDQDLCELSYGTRLKS